MTRSARLSIAGAVGLAWIVFGLLRFDQGLDLAVTGRWVLGAWLEATGRAVHAFAATDDGAFRYLVLGAWMRVFGPGFSAAAGLLVLLHALVAGLLAVWTLRRGPWVTALGQLTLLAAAPLDFGVLWAALTLLLPPCVSGGIARARVAGVLLSALLVTDALLFVLVAPLLALAPASMDRRASLRQGMAALATGIGLVVVHAVLSGATTSTLSNSFAGPWHTLAEGPGPARLFGALVDGAWLDRPFAGLATGEPLGPAWPAHGAVRALGLRLAGIVVLVAPLAWIARRRGGLGALLALAAVALAVTRGDLPTLTVALVPAALAWALLEDGAGSIRRVALLLAAFASLPLAGENLWLVAHQGREGLVRWDAPRVGVKLAAQRRDGLHTAVERLHLPADQPALVWSGLPGLHVVLGTVPAVPWLEPPRNQQADQRIADVLTGGDRPVVLFAPHPDLLPQNLEPRLPRTTTALRRDYRLRGTLPAGGLNLRAIAPGARPGDPLAAELPRVECMVAPAARTVSPALRDEIAIGQSFRIEDDDLRGFAISLVTDADSVEVELRARVWERPGAEYNSLLEARTLSLVARRGQPMHWVEFPVPDTAGRDLALLFECRGTPRAEVRFAWHENASGFGIGDVYEQGSAMLDFTPVEADLIMLIY